MAAWSSRAGRQDSRGAGVRTGVLRTHVRRGDPLEFSGAVTGLDDPRYAALLGALNYSIQIEGRGGSMIESKIDILTDALEGLGGIFNKLKDVTKAFKI